MPLIQARPIRLTERERQHLEGFVRQHSCPQQLALRARIVLLADAGVGVRETVRQLDASRSTVQGWRRRWLAGAKGSVAERLSDAPRPGAPAIFSAEQICAIIALACESPQDSARPMTHWTQQELADEAMKRGIVESISQRSVGRFLKRSRPQAASHTRLVERQDRRALRGKMSRYL